MYEVVTDLQISSSAIERQLAQLVSELKQYVKIPIAVKLAPFFASFGNLARQLDRAGADGLVMFNRFYQPDIDIKTMATTDEVRLSTSDELRLRLRWLAILFDRIRPSLIATGGVATPEDGVKALLAGADAIQVVSAILRHGPAYFTTLRDGVEHWMEEHGIDDIDAVRGRASLKDVVDPGAFERAHYIKVLHRLKAVETT
jgi:dihydroorotate dehydrogenase (fumarate)